MKQTKLHKSISTHIGGIFLSGLLMLATVPVWADETGKIGANVTYTLTDDGTLTISGTGDMTDYNYEKSPVFNNQSIKKIIIANGITSIGKCAFCNCYNLTSVDIPTSITSINSTAFYGCHKMKTIYVSPNNIRYCTANGVLYTKDMTTLIVYPGGQTSVTIPNSITNIGDYAFASCGGLTSINIPNSVTSIGYYAFNGCSGLTSINIPNSVTSIGDGAFNGCSGLTSINIPNSVTSIGYYAFNGCSGLTSINIPNSVTSIGDGAFNGCSGLTSINIPNSVTSIENGAFAGCKNIISVTLNCKNINSWFANKTTIKEIVIGESVTNIVNGAFAGCTGLTAFNVNPDNECYCSVNGVLYTKDMTTLVGCPGGATSIIIPNSVTNIRNGAFEGCTNLTSVTLNCKNINSWFANKTTIKEIVIGESVTNIVNGAFAGCTGLTAFNVNPDNECYCSVNGVLYTKDMTTLVGCPGGATSIIIPNSVTNIRNGAFEGCSELPAFDVSSDNEYYCSVNGVLYTKDMTTLVAYPGGATSIIIPNPVTNIRNGAFAGCKNIISVTLNCKNIDSWFANMTNIKEIVIGESVTNIVNGAFAGCKRLTEFNVSPDNEYYCSVNGVLYTKDMTTLVAYPGGLTSVTIPNSVISIRDKAFMGCSGLTLLVDRYSPLIPNLWAMGYTVQDKDTGEVINKSYLDFSYSQEYTSVTLKLYNYVKGYTYMYKGWEIKGDVITIDNVWPGYQGTIVVKVDCKGFEYTISKEITIKNLPISFTKSCSTTSATASIALGECGLNVVSTKIFIDNESTHENTLQVSGLDPNYTYDTGYEITLRNAVGEKKTYSNSYSFRTNSLVLKVLPPKVVSPGNVIVAAETNIDEEESNVGFEWRRTDWTSEFTSQTGAGHTYGGTMEGYIRNLNTEKLWKVRPFYLSDSGNYYYGDWMGIDPSNTSYFEPTVHTYAKISVEGNAALVKGYALGGTDKVKVQGFKYWKSTASNRAMSTRAANIPLNAMTVEAEGQVMTATLQGLDYASEYHYVAFVTTTEGETFYGDERTFSTGEDPTGIDAPSETATQPTVEIARYSLDGRKLDAPQKGVNIIRMSDGTTKKVMVK